MCETFINEKDFGIYGKFLHGYKLKCVAATRRFSVGRASGGMVVGIKEESGIEFLRWHDIECMNVCELNVWNAKFWLLPVYMTYSDWDNCFRMLNECVESLRNNNKRLILMGDFNARIGELQELNEAISN